MMRIYVTIEHSGATFPPADWEQRIHDSLEDIAERMQELFQEYPPETIGNSPANPSGRWWERLFGWRFSSGASLPISEKLKYQWHIAPEGTTGVNLKNTASYASAVHSTAWQVDMHQRIGWPTGEKIVKELLDSGSIGEILDKHLLGGLDG